MASIQQRRTKAGKLRYQVFIRIRGKRPLIKTFATLGKARAWAAKEESALRFSRDFKVPDGDRVTLEDAIDRFLEYNLEHYSPSYSPDVKERLKIWKEQLGSLFVSRIQASDILAVRDALAAKVSPATANRYVTALSAVLTRAVKEWDLIDHNPCHRLRRLSEEKGRTRYLEPDELVKLRTAVKGSRSRHLYPEFILSVATGIRRSEMLALEWRNIDLVRGCVTIEQSSYRETTKNRRARVIPLVEDAKKAMKEWKKSDPTRIDGRVFPEIFPRSAWEHALELAGLSDFRWHDLRHTCASYLAMHGVPARTIAEILGHQTLQMVQRYSHLSPEHLRESMGGVQKILGRNAAPVQQKKKRKSQGT